LDQFTRQAVPFATSPGVRSEEALRLVIEMTGAGAQDTTLDVACGPGLIVCAFAKVVRHATGIDLTPAMLARARQEAAALSLQNVSWHLGDGTALPYADGSFSIVSSRYAFHHLTDPFAVLQEMCRVCKPGGRIALIDSSPIAEKAEAFNRMEKLRDPSHVRAMPVNELCGLFNKAGLAPPRTATYRLRGEFESLLSRSFPHPGDEVKLRHLFESSIADDPLDMDLRQENGQILYGHPTVVLVSSK
jgi:SAM-dependent methyltransferase